ncbi:MAG: GNAT family N-acetyltransferase [Granulosicoccus sp.]|nr:GNAT family N-acetyltransferase [Granulosicoccus sp.]
MSIQQSEAIESDALEALLQVASDSDKIALGLDWERSDSVLFASAANLPDTAIVINRTMVNPGPIEDHDTILKQIVDKYRRAKVGSYLVQVTSDQTTTAARQGLHPTRAWQKFKRGTAPISLPSSRLSVKRITEKEGHDFARIVCPAFDLGEEAQSWFSKLPASPNWQIYMCFDDGSPAGVGALYVKGDAAWLDFGATAPEHRQKGVQTSVLATRVNAALAQGCTQLFTCTGVDVPGDPQHSYKNILKVGFEESYVRYNYTLASDNTV